MCVNVYTAVDQIPAGIQLIRNNDVYFDNMTNLNDDSISRMIMKTSDRAKYHSPLTFIGRDPSLGALNKDFLSTGAKTLLNILQHSDKCFDVCECENNALCLLTKIKSGNILWSAPIMAYFDDDPSCSFNFQGKLYTNVFDFLEVTCER